MAEQPDQVAVLHRRASEWYEQNGSPADAIRHALAGEDFERAADLIERAFPTMSRNRQEAILLGWLKALPDDADPRPVPCSRNLYAGALLQSGEIKAWSLAAGRRTVADPDGMTGVSGRMLASG